MKGMKKVPDPTALARSVGSELIRLIRFRNWKWGLTVLRGAAGAFGGALGESRGASRRSKPVVGLNEKHFWCFLMVHIRLI